MRPPGCIYGDPSCIVDKRFQCDQTSKVYRISCVSCNSEINDEPETESPNYVGKTRSSLHARMSDHIDGQRRKASGIPLHRHDSTHHEGQPQIYTCIPVASERKIVRLNINEALHIEKQNRMASINDKMECGRGGLIRISATRVTS